MMYSGLPEHANRFKQCANYLNSRSPRMLSYIFSIKLLIVLAASGICAKGERCHGSWKTMPATGNCEVY